MFCHVNIKVSKLHVSAKHEYIATTLTHEQYFFAEKIKTKHFMAIDRGVTQRECWISLP